MYISNEVKTGCTTECLHEQACLRHTAYTEWDTIREGESGKSGPSTLLDEG